METIPASCNSTQRKGEPEIITSKTTRFVRPVSDSKRTESTDPLSISSDLAGSRPRCASFIYAELASFDETSGATQIGDPSPEASFTTAMALSAASLLFLHPCATVLALLLAACRGRLLRGRQVKKKSVEGRRHAAGSVQLHSARRLQGAQTCPTPCLLSTLPSSGRPCPRRLTR